MATPIASRFPRASGILLHPTSLPGPYGIGSLGAPAFRFVELLAEAGQRYWQVLPLGPTGFGDSPYQCLSSFAGNTALIDLEALCEVGWLTADELADHPPFRARSVDYEAVIVWHEEMLTRAYERFLARPRAEQTAFEAWCARPAIREWLDDFALYAALKEQRNLRAWVEWGSAAFYESDSARQARTKLAYRISHHKFRQWLFDQQWTALKLHANGRGIQIIGDTPFYVGHDCADVWANRHLFDLDAYGVPVTIAGVPPDGFAPTGQRWGNPIYLWQRHRGDQYRWWVSRIDGALRLYDLLRIDHFRAFYNFWRIPAESPTAVEGRWEDGPRETFFMALGPGRNQRIIAEDLGDQMEGPCALRDAVGLPGMIVVQFAYTGTPEDQRRFQEDRGSVQRVVYPGTHDNNTSLGWWQSETTPVAREAFLRDTAHYGVPEIHWAMLHLCMEAHAAHTSIVPMQDLLGLASSARMNRPAIEAGNWRWRCTESEMENAPWERLLTLTRYTNRLPAG